MNYSPWKSLRSHEHRAVVTVITATRREAGFTQDRLSAELQWCRSRLAKIESYERRVDVPELIFISRALGIDPCEVLRRILSWTPPAPAADALAREIP